MQLEPKANLLIVTELISKLEVQGHPAISSSSAFRKEVKLPAHIVSKTYSDIPYMQKAVIVQHSRQHMFRVLHGTLEQLYCLHKVMAHQT